MEVFVFSLFNGILYGMLLFLLASGLTLIFSMMGVLNFAHASFFMLGAYFAYEVSSYVGFWPALIFAPIIVGVIGAGRVGQQMAEIARGIGMNVIAWTLHPEQYNPETTGLEFVELSELLSRSDAISIHMRGSAETHHMIGSSELAQMKPSAFVINTSRGDIIDEEALEEALRDGALAGAGLDTFETEPLSAESTLRTLPNALLSPHTASTTDAALAESLKMVVDNVLSFLDGDIQHQVKFSAEHRHPESGNGSKRA